jgi:hypothetical protein
MIDNGQILNTSSKYFQWVGRTGLAAATTLRLPAGNFPQTIQVKSTRTGQTLEFTQTAINTVYGEVATVEYTSPCGILAVLMNDWND